MENTTFKKVKKIKARAFDDRLVSVCDELLKLNPETSFIVSKKFREESEEISGLPVIATTTPIENLTIPSCFGLKGQYLTCWCDSDPLVKLVHSEIKYTDGEINGRLVRHLYVDVENVEEIRKSKKYKG